MKLKVVFAVALVQCAIVMSAAGASNDPKPMFSLTYKELPFGKAQEDILGWLEEQDKVVVYEDKSVSVNQFYCYQALTPYFSSGVRKTDSQGPQFYNYLIKKYVVERCGSIFPNTFRADFYFVKGDKEDKYKLFMVYKVQRVESGAMKDLYAKEMESCLKEYGKASRSWETNSTGSNKANNDRLIPASVTQWDFSDGSVFFMMADNGMQQYKEFLFVSNSGWSTYLKSLEKARAWK